MTANRNSLAERIRRDRVGMSSFGMQKNWADAVRARDRGCMECGATSSLRAHHIEPLSSMIERLGITTIGQARQHYDTLWSLSNGKTLCVWCEDEAHGRVTPGAAA